MQKTMRLSAKAIVLKIAPSPEITIQIITSLFVLLFIYTGLSKLFTISFFRDTMAQSKLLSPYAKILSYSVPIVEIVVSVLLAIPFFRKVGLYLSTGLMFLFTAYVGYTLIAYAHNLPCSCGGIIGVMNWQQHLVFNIFFLTLGILAIRLTRKVKPVR